MTAHLTTMKSVGVREFRANASTYLSGTEPIAVNRHGKVIGFYIPLDRDDDEVERAIALLPATLEKVLERTGTARDRRR
jgi:antitoxin (DNA-binding transcriptional repressor) of toxin-antitoxin stability system